MVMELTKKLAEFIQDTNYKDFPPEVLEKGKNCILDCLGSALGGIDDEASKIIIAYVKL
jgi:2-methylcitrate dehydratase PrpD